MLQIVTGPFQPTLEQALLKQIQEIKTLDPIAPLSLVVPSESLRRYLKYLLVEVHGVVLLHVHVLTFHQFSQRLLNDGVGAEGLGPPSVQPEGFFKEVIHYLLKRESLQQSPLSGYAEMPGAWSALWGTLKQLKDAGIQGESQILLNLFLEEGEPFRKDRLGTLSSLLNLYDHWTHVLREQEIGDFEDYAVRALERVSGSKFLSGQAHTIYYGFYDLTQVQLDLFKEVVRHYPTTSYFPLEFGNPDYQCAQRFFDRYIRGLGEVRERPPSSTRLRGEEGVHLGTKRDCRIVNVRGRTDEVTVVAKEILGLVEEQGYGFHEIGVVARTLTDYQRELPEVFSEHGIPFHSTIGEPLRAFPYIQTLWHLLLIRVEDFQQEHVLEFFSSPFVCRDALTVSEDLHPFAFRPDIWSFLQSRLGIRRGFEAWKRVESFHAEGFPLARGKDESKDGRLIPGDAIRWFSEALSTVHVGLEIFPVQGSWRTYADAVSQCMNRFLRSEGDGTVLSGDRHAAVIQRLHLGLDYLASLDPITGPISLSDFRDAFERMIDEVTVPCGPPSGMGVQVLDVMEARGLSFRAVCVMGLNDKVFPRHIREDPFLRDEVRRRLETDIGYKIPEKLAGYDEERLLFSLLRVGAKEELILTYVRCDDAGRVLAPSSYIDDIKRDMGGPAEHTIPHSLLGKCEHGEIFASTLLTPKEWVTHALLGRKIPHDYLQGFYPGGRLLLSGLDAGQRLDRRVHLSEFDGITGCVSSHWETKSLTGFSPTALQDYAACPFRYFGNQVLSLVPLDQDKERLQTDPLGVGTILHELMQAAMEQMRSRGVFRSPPSEPVNIEETVREVARPVFQRFSRLYATGLPLLWEILQDRLLMLVQTVLTQDVDDMRQEGWEPILLEAKLSEKIEIELRQGWKTVVVKGYPDRIDRTLSRELYRIIDYKYKGSGSPDTTEKNLTLGAVRGIRLQPPLYAYLLEKNKSLVSLTEGQETHVPDCQGVWFYYFAPNWSEKEEEQCFRYSFPGDAWSSSLRPFLERTIRFILQGIHDGNFFIHPGRHCVTCSFRTICRRTHQPTRSRVQKDPLAHDHARTLKQARVPIDG